MKELVLFSNTDFFKFVLNYICEKYSDQVNQFQYLSEHVTKRYEYRRKKVQTFKTCFPCDTTFDLNFKEKSINFTLETIKKDNGDLQKLIQQAEACFNATEEILLQQITLKGETKELLIEFVDVAKKYCEEQIKSSQKSSRKTIKVFLWRKEYWNLLFKSPKRPIETLYLKEDQKESLLSKVEEFFSPETRDDYLSFGIPYKNVFLLYGVPGSGKTSTINTIASHFDADIYVIPISKELTDYMLMDAIAYLDKEDEEEDKKRIIVIEDIDSIFTDRKKGDDIHNSLSLQALLNCFDGFSCVEGTLLFITANKPEVLDYAMIRSCRVDHKYELGYADKYQTKSIFDMVLPSQKETFNQFYKQIESKEYTTAMLQEFLFFNRKCDDILSKIEEFYEIIDKNNPKNFELKEKNENIYM